MNKTIQLSSKILGFIVIVNSLFIFVYVVGSMLILGNKETKIMDNVVLRFDVPTEYISTESFWWLTEGKNRIRIVNFSDEKHIGVFTLKISQNPCRNARSVKIGEQNYIFETEEQTLSAEYKFIANPYGEQNVEINVLNDYLCKVNGTDQRNFGIKINSWVIK